MSRFRKESTAPEETGAVREKSGNGWFRNHWCALSLCIIVIVAFALRTVFAYGISADGGFALSGGSSAQYHLHVIESILNGSYSMTDSAVNYPNGGLNVYPPLVDFIAAGIASVLTSMGMSTTEAASAAIGAFNPVIGALTCIPVYLVAKEMFDKRVGVVAALVFAFLALPISTTVFSNGTEYGLAAFLVAFMSWFAVRMVKAADAETPSVKSILVNAVVVGIFLALAALTWNGFRCLVVLLVVAMVIQIIADRFRGRDFRNVLIGYIVAILVGVLIPAAYYMPAGLWDAVYSGPLMIAVIAAVLSLVFLAVRSKPWVVTVPALVIVFIVIAAILAVAAPDMFNDLIFGNSYYSSTIMDELASSHVSMSNVSAYYGWLTMWLPICYAIYSLYVYLRRDHSATRLFITIWMFGMFFAVWTSSATAAVVGPVFAVGSAVVIVRALEAAKIRDWAHDVRVAGFPGAFKKLIRPFPLLSVLVVAFLIVVPNVSYAVDAGISNNSDADYYFSGNTQYTIKTGDSYPMEGLWDTYEDMPKDGALVTWIDYAYDAVSQGGFDSVTDTVGGGASAAAQMYLSEGAGGSVAAMMMRLILAHDSTDLSSCFGDKASVYQQIAGYIADPSTAVQEIEENPETYGSVRSDITDENAIYLASLNAVLTGMDDVEIMNAYDAVCSATGDRISYFLFDPSLLPLQYGDGSSFSTIAYFADYSVDNYGAATQFYSYNTYYGYTVYTSAIYDTFLWKAMIGPSAAEAGFTGSNASYDYLVALSSSDGSKDSAKAIPGYGLAGFEVAYWQLMYNPDSDASVTDDGWEYMDAYEAMQKQAAEGGSINYLSSIIMLEYTGVPAEASTVDGSVMSGTTGVDGATVSVYQYDETFGQYVLYSQTRTLDGGQYTAMVPSGDYRVVIGIGDVTIQSYTSSSFVPGTTEVPATSVEGDVMVGDEVYGAEPMLLKLTGDTGSYDVQIVDGHISIGSILPGTYDYVLYDEDGDSIGTGSVSVYPGENIGFSVTPTTRTITASVNDVNGQPVADGALVIATNVDNGAQFQAAVEDGQAVISVVSGQYTLSMGHGYASMYTSTANATSGNRSATLTAYNADTVTISNAPAQHVIASAGSFSTVSYEYEGQVCIDLPRSIGTDAVMYTLYGVSGGNVYHAAYTGGGSVILQSGTAGSVSGQLMDGDSGEAGTVMFIDALNETFSVATDSEGNFSALLPTGSYTVAANNGSDKVYFGTATVGSNSDLGEIDLVDGRRIQETVRYDRGMSGSQYTNLPFVLGAIEFTYNDHEYRMYSMSNTSGQIQFYIPDDVDSTTYINNLEGTIDNGYLTGTGMTRDVDGGTSNNTNTNTFAIRDSEDEDQKMYVTPMDVNVPYDMEIEYYDDGSDVEPTVLEQGSTVSLRPGQYTVTIDGESGHYFSGTMYVYPGTTEFSGVENVEEVATVNVTNAETDLVSVSTTDGSYHRFDGGYYFEVGYEYFLTSTNTNSNGDRLIDYGYVDLTGTSERSFTIDMTASQERMEVTGYAGVNADGTIEVSYQDGNTTVRHEFDVNDGAYTLYLPANVTSVDASVELSVTENSETRYYSATGFLNNLRYEVDDNGHQVPCVRNISVISSEAPAENPEAEGEQPGFDATVDELVFAGGLMSGTVRITNNTDTAKTYLISSGADLSLDRAYSINVSAHSTGSQLINGTYDANRVAPGSEGMTITVEDINGTDSSTIDLTTGGQISGNGVEILKADDEDDRAAPNRVSAYQYMYAVTIVNNDTYTHEVSISVPEVSGWAITIVDEDGNIVAQPGRESTFDAYGLQTTVLYVKMMLLEPGNDTATVPNITADVYVDGTQSRSLDMSAGDVQVTTDDMTVSGGNALDERSGVPGGIWFLVVVVLLLLVVIFWLASKRGVFTRRN